MPVTIAVTGQILIHRPLLLEGEGAEDVVSFLKSEATIANFEGVVEAEGAWATKAKTVHAVNAAAVRSIAELGFHAVAHANNHAFDLGPPGIVASHAAMQKQGIAICGSGPDLRQALLPAVVRTGSSTITLFSVDLGPQGDIVYAAPDRAGIAPLRMRRVIQLPPREYETLVAIRRALGDDQRLAARQAVGYSASQAGEGFEAFGTAFIPGDTIASQWTPDSMDLERITLEMGCAKAAGELVVLAVHNHNWDADWTATPTWFDQLTDRLVEAGADAIVGTGAPVMQPMRFHRGRPILSGLGNFVFHTGRPQTYDEKGVDVWRSVALRLVLETDGRCLGIEAMPVSVGRPSADETAPAPRPLDAMDANVIFERFVSRLDAGEKAQVRRVPG